MTEQAIRSATRLSVVGDAGRVDLAVPLGARIAEVAQAYVDGVGAAGPVRLATTVGRGLAPQGTVGGERLRDGDVLVVVDDAGDAEVVPATPAAEQGTRPGWWAGALLWAAPPAGALAGVLGAGAADEPARTLVAFLLLLGAVVAALPLGGSRETGRRRASTAPAFAGSGGFLLGWSDGPGGLVLAVAVAAMLAGAAAATARSLQADDGDEPLVVWLAACALAAPAALGVLLLGAPAEALWTLLFVAAVIGSRSLPHLVVDVPDQVLLDLDRLAITAWSARERPRGRARRRSLIRADQVRSVVRRGHRLVEAGSLAIAVVAVVSGVLLVTGGGDGIEPVGRQVLVFLGGASLALVSRSFRARWPRLGLRVAGWATLTTALVDVLLSDLGEGRWWVVTGCALVSLVVVAAAIALGRGWRSIWWARTTDVVESLCVVGVIAVTPVALGLVTWARQATSG